MMSCCDMINKPDQCFFGQLYLCKYFKEEESQLNQKLQRKNRTEKKIREKKYNRKKMSFNPDECTGLSFCCKLISCFLFI